MPDKNQPFVSIIIPALNEEKYIVFCFTSLKNLDYPKELYEIILVDNGSKDRTVEIAKRYGAQILSKLEGSISSLRNFGVKLAKGNYLGFIDADCQASIEWLAKGISYLKNVEIAAVGCRLRHDESTWVAKSWSLIHADKVEEGEVDWIPSGNMLVSKTAFEKVGGFNEDLLTSEDVDLCLQLRSAGYKIISDPNISALHLDPPKTLYEFFKKELWHGQGMLKTTNRKFLWASRALVYAIFYTLCMVSMAFGIVISFIFKSHWFLIFSFFLFILAPLLLAIKTVLINKSYKSMFGLILIYMTYGLARSVCLLGYRK